MQASDITDNDIQHYEGLVRKTASMYVGVVEEEYEDLCQLIRVKCWRALVAYDPKRSRMARDPFVFGCVRNLVKDLIKRERRDWLFIEDIAPHNSNGNGIVRDAFELRYLQLDEADAYALVEEEVTLPSTLTERERQVVSLLYLAFDYTEISQTIGIAYSDVTKAMKAVREKMADWAPSKLSDRDTAVPLAA